MKVRPNIADLIVAAKTRDLIASRATRRRKATVANVCVAMLACTFPPPPSLPPQTAANPPQLQTKISELEKGANAAVNDAVKSIVGDKESPKLILIGPPGAGTSSFRSSQ